MMGYEEEVIMVGQGEEPQPIATPDFEFMVIATCIDAFSKMDPESVKRVLRYLMDRYGEKYLVGVAVAEETQRRGSKKN